MESVESRPCWFVGAMFGDDDQTTRFLKEGIWENGYEDKYHNLVNTMEPGDKIAIKSSYVRKNNLPFNNRGQAVSVMKIKATGTIKATKKDGQHIEVEWDASKPNEEWFFYTYRATIWKVDPSKNWYQKNLCDFTFFSGKQDIERFRNDPYWAERYGTSAEIEKSLGEFLDQTKKLKGLSSRQAAAQYIVKGEDWGEVANRQRAFEEIAILLANPDIDMPALKRCLHASKILPPHSSFGSMMNDFFNASGAKKWLSQFDPSIIFSDAEELDKLVEQLVDLGFKDRDGNKKLSEAAFFLSIILSSVYPQDFMEFRHSRLSKLAREFKEPDFQGGYGEKLLQAKTFYQKIVATTVFIENFEECEFPNAIVGGLSWIMENKSEWLKGDEMNNFLWVTFYEQMADALLKYKDDRRELVKIIHSINKGAVLQDEDKEGKKFDLEDICPFTVMALFNRQITKENRTSLAKGLARFLGVQAEVPNLFDGIPVVNNQKTWFFSYSKTRLDGDIDSLWDMFSAAIEYANTRNKEDESVFKGLYDKVLKQNGVRWNLTMGFYWLRPLSFPTLDKKSRDYIESNLRLDVPERCDADSYISILKSLEEKFKDKACPVHSFPELSMMAEDYSSNSEKDKVKGSASTESVTPQLNTILYGPPGTGKTYNTVIKAVEICEPDFKGDYNAAKKRYKELKEEGRIEFVTFHQSYGYEEFIEGIRTDTESGEISYVKEDGVFKRSAINALFDACSKSNESQSLGFFELYSRLIDDFYSNEELVLESSTGKSIGVRSVSKAKNLHCYHEGKDQGYTVGKNRLKKLYEVFNSLEKLEGIERLQDAFKEVIGGANQTVYWSVLNYLLRLKSSIHDNKEKSVRYEAKKAWLHEQKDISIAENARNFVLIIDEINRGNMSKIFGELITLIEDDKRIGADNEMSVRLPVSGDEFGVPENLYIIGTMNTADRSIAMMDTALRRRFEFEEMMPKLSVLEGVKVGDIELDKMLGKINQRIEVLYDREHTIGHAYFMGLNSKPSIDDSKPSIDDLGRVFENKVIPLLAEYFFEDWGKIRMVLGDNQKINPEHHFITEKKNVDYKALFGANEDDSFADERKVYERNSNALLVAESYIGIYDKHSANTKTGDDSPETKN